MKETQVVLGRNASLKAKMSKNQESYDCVLQVGNARFAYTKKAKSPHEISLKDELFSFIAYGSLYEPGMTALEYANCQEPPMKLSKAEKEMEISKGYYEELHKEFDDDELEALFYNFEEIAENEHEM